MTEMEMVRSMIDRGFSDLHRRMDEQRDLNADRHKENIGRFATVRQELEDVRKSVLTKALATWYLGAFLAGVGAFGWLLHLIGVIK